MKYKKLMPCARSLAVLSAIIALIATVYALGAATPQEALASSHVEYVYSDWDPKPNAIGGGDQFRLIFLSSTKRKATSLDIADYNTFIRDLTSKGRSAIRPYADGFNVVGCTASMPGFPAGVNARDNTGTTGTGVPIYWLKGNRVANNYADFYDGSWDDEANVKNESGDNGLNINQSANRPWTGCEHDGTEAFVSGASEGLGENDVDFVRVGQPNSSGTGHGPLNSNGDYEDSNQNRPMYGLSQVFEVIQIPGNTGTLTTGGTPRTGSISGSDVGEYWRVKLHQNGKYRIDVKGSESSQYGGTLTNPLIKLLAGNSHVELLNDEADGVSQTGPETLATGGGVGKNSRLDIKVTGETRYYYMLIHRGAGDKGSFTLTANRLDYPQGRLAPDITVDQENRTSVSISWTESKKTHNSLVAPETTYEIDRRTLPEENWSSVARRISPGNRTSEVTGLTAATAYEIRVRMVPIPGADSHTYQWGYATIYTDDCAETGGNICSIDVNQSKKGRINYHATDDIDGYTVRLVSNRTYVIRVNGKSTNTGSLMDPTMKLDRNLDDNTVADNNNGGTGLNSKITYTPTHTGDYNIVVSSAADGRGTYRVKVTEK